MSLPASSLMVSSWLKLLPRCQWAEILGLPSATMGSLPSPLPSTKERWRIVLGQSPTRTPQSGITIIPYSSGVGYAPFVSSFGSLLKALGGVICPELSRTCCQGLRPLALRRSTCRPRAPAHDSHCPGATMLTHSPRLVGRSLKHLWQYCASRGCPAATAATGGPYATPGHGRPSVPVSAPGWATAHGGGPSATVNCFLLSHSGIL